MSKRKPEFQMPPTEQRAEIDIRATAGSEAPAEAPGVEPLAATPASGSPADAPSVEAPTEAPLSDVCLMLRTHAEMRCLSREVIPVLRQVETRKGLPEDQLGAALAYLEVTWIEARRRAAETDAAYAELTQTLGLEECEGDPVYGSACRYRAAVLVLREVVTRRVDALLASTTVGVTQGGEG